MQVIYTGQPPVENRQSIFLCGPSPRTAGRVSWRREAVTKLQSIGFTGTVYVPEYEHPSSARLDYLPQASWEWNAMENHAGVILFWVPRYLIPSDSDLGTPGFTTNTEFGRMVSIRPQDVVYGRPSDSEKNRYLDALYQRLTSKTPLNNLAETLQAACTLALAKAP